jgi:hypothetical protein
VRRAAAGLWAALALGSCQAQQAFPGTEVMGSFNFTATPLGDDCDGSYAGDFPPDSGPDSGFGFTATLSRDPGTPQVWFTLNGNSWDAGFDGQYVTVSLTRNRQFTACGTCQMTVVETVDFALLSTSQYNAVGQACPQDPLDGGVPLPDGGADGGGIFGPRSTPTGFDVALACGTMSDQVEPTDPSCAAQNPGCIPCTFQYGLVGIRQ